MATKAQLFTLKTLDEVLGIVTLVYVWTPEDGQFMIRDSFPL